MAKFYYNGVLLPEIPSDVLAEYPYAFIGYVTTSGKYQILASKQPIYLTNSTLTRQNTNNEPYLSCFDGDDVWTIASGNYTWSIDSTRILKWSSHDIYQVVNSIPTVYFEATEPVPEIEEEVSWYQIKKSTLTSFGDEARRLNGGTTLPLTTSQMLEIFENANAGIDGGYNVAFYNTKNKLFNSNSIKSGQAINPPIYSAKNWVDSEGRIIAFPYIPTKDISLYPDSSGYVAKLYDLYDISPLDYPYVVVTYTTRYKNCYLWFGDKYSVSMNDICLDVHVNKLKCTSAIQFDTVPTMDKIVSGLQNQKPTLSDRPNSSEYMANPGYKYEYTIYTNIKDSITIEAELIVIE